MTKTTLTSLRAGETATVSCLNSCGAIRRRLLDLGLVCGTCIKCLGCSPGGKMSAYQIRGAVIAIRKQDADNIYVRLADKKQSPAKLC